MKFFFSTFCFHPFHIMDSTLVFLCVLATVLSKGFAVVCEDDPTWTDSDGFSCADYVGYDCDLYPEAKEACLLTCNICEIDPEPSPTPTATTSTT